MVQRAFTQPEKDLTELTGSLGGSSDDLEEFGQKQENDHSKSSQDALEVQALARSDAEAAQHIRPAPRCRCEVVGVLAHGSPFSADSVAQRPRLIVVRRSLIGCSAHVVHVPHKSWLGGGPHISPFR